MESKISRKLNDLVALGRKNQSLVETVDRKINALEDSIDMKIEGKFEVNCALYLENDEGQFGNFACKKIGGFKNLARAE
jgi:hypothetical protein